MFVKGAVFRARAQLNYQQVEERVNGEIALPGPDAVGDTPTAWHICKPQIFAPPAAYLPSEASKHGLLHPQALPQCSAPAPQCGSPGTTGALSHFGPLGPLIFCARMGARARAQRALRTNQNRAIPFTGSKKDLGTLTGRNRIPQKGIRRYGRRVTHLSLCFESRHDSPRRCLPSCSQRRQKVIVFCAHDPFASSPKRAARRQSPCPGIPTTRS